MTEVTASESAFDVAGFLAESMFDELKQLAYQQGPQLHWVRDVAVRAWRRQYELGIPAEDRVGHLRLALYCKIVSTAQAAVLLLEHGMVQQAEALTRVALEACFTLGAVTNDAAMGNSIVAAYHNSQKKRVRRLRELPELFEVVSARTSELDQVLSEADVALQDKELKERTVEQLAKCAGMSGEYVVLFTSLSDAVHSTARDLDRFVAPSGEGIDIENGPEFERVPAAAANVGLVLIAAMRMTAQDSETQLVEYLTDTRAEMHRNGFGD